MLFNYPVLKPLEYAKDFAKYEEVMFLLSDDSPCDITVHIWQGFQDTFSQGNIGKLLDYQN